MRFNFIETQKGWHPVSRLYLPLGPSGSGYCTLRNCTPSARALQDAMCGALGPSAHRRIWGTSGRTRVLGTLREQRVLLAKERGGRLPSARGIVGESRTRRWFSDGPGRG